MRDAVPRPPLDPLRLVVPAALAAAITMVGLVLAHDVRRPAEQRARSIAFQELLHGLGTGAATDLSRDPHAFDSRLGRSPFGTDWLLRAASAGRTGEPPRGD